MVANLNVRDALADRLDDAAALVAEHDGEVALGVVAGKLRAGGGGGGGSAPIVRLNQTAAESGTHREEVLQGAAESTRAQE